MGDAFAKGDTVRAAREYDPPATALHQLGLTADAQAEREQTALQALATVDLDQTDTLTDRQLADRDNTCQAHFH